MSQMSNQAVFRASPELTPRLRVLDVLSAQGVCSGSRLIHLAGLGSAQALVDLARSLSHEGSVCIAGNRVDPAEIGSAQFSIFPSKAGLVANELRQATRI